MAHNRNKRQFVKKKNKYSDYPKKGNKQRYDYYEEDEYEWQENKRNRHRKRHTNTTINQAYS